MARIRDSVGGRWATSVRSWAVLFVPSLLPVIVQESVLPVVTIMFIVVTVLAQQLATLVPILIASFIRRQVRHGTIPVWFIVLTWTVVAIIRGIIGGLVEVQQFGGTPDYLLRTVFWLGIAWIWIPLYLYVMGQLDVRHAGVRALRRAAARRDDARAQQMRAASTLRDQLVATVHSTVMPVIDDIRRGLRTASGSFDPASLGAISDRLLIVTRDAAKIVDGTPPDLSDARSGRLYPRSLMKSLLAGPGSPLIAALFTGALLAVVVIPASTRSARPEDAVDAFAAVVVATAALALLLVISRRMFVRVPRVRAWCVPAAAVTAGLFGSLALLAASVGSPGDHNLILATVFPLCVIACSGLVALAGTLAATNQQTRVDLSRIDAETRDIEEATRANEARVRAQLSAVLHGPVYGRLSACVMALNFTVSEQVSGSSTRGRTIAAGIIDHLDLASTDLDALLKDSPRR